MEPRWRHEQQAHAAATVGGGGSKHHGRLAAPGREAAWYPRPGCGLAGHALHITSTGQTQAKVRPTGAAANRISGYRRDNLRADIGVIDSDAGRSDSAICVGRFLIT